MSDGHLFVSAWSALEPVVVALIVLASAGYAARRLWPAAWRRARVAGAIVLLREGRAPWLRVLGRTLAPTPALPVPKAASSCGPCRGCERSA